jgi:hypothetical protein
MGQGGRPALHAETASRGSEPVASPTGSKEVELRSRKVSKRIEGLDAFEESSHVEALIEGSGFGVSEISTDEAGESGGVGQNEGASQAESAGQSESARQTR